MDMLISSFAVIWRAMAESAKARVYGRKTTRKHRTSASVAVPPFVSLVIGVEPELGLRDVKPDRAALDIKGQLQARLA